MERKSKADRERRVRRTGGWCAFLLIFSASVFMAVNAPNPEEASVLYDVKLYGLFTVLAVLLAFFLSVFVKSEYGTGAEEPYFGKELIVDLHGCNTERFNREDLDEFFENVCGILGVERDDVYFWDDLEVPEEEQQTEPHTQGTTAVQFILTSNVTVHTLDQLEAVYLNVFSCGDYDEGKVLRYAKGFFGARVASHEVLKRE